MNREAAAELREGLTWMRSSRNKHLRTTGICWSAALGAIAGLVGASEEERRALATEIAQLFTEGGDAWAAFLEGELSQTLAIDDDPDLRRASRMLTTFRRAVRGEPIAREMLISQIESLAKRVAAAREKYV